MIETLGNVEISYGTSKSCGLGDALDSARQGLENAYDDADEYQCLKSKQFHAQAAVDVAWDIRDLQCLYHGGVSALQIIKNLCRKFRVVLCEGVCYFS